MGEYKESLNLPQTDMPMRAGLAQREPEILAFWDRVHVYEASLAKNQGQPEFILHDGPPYPNGNIHAGHALNKILKDIVVKYKTMKGFYSPYIPGWDCHGLPIETQLLKELKKKKETIPPEKEFRQRCKEYALGYVDIQREQFKRLGIRGDWENPYLTLNDEYEKNVNALVEKLYDKGYVTKGRKPIHWCYDCQTALAEAEIEYEDHKSPSIYVQFKVLSSAFRVENNLEPRTLNLEPLNFIVWTTTPWTLPANVAVAVHPKFNYALVKAKDAYWLLAEDLVESVMQRLEWTDYTIEQTILGRDLEGAVCQHPFYDREAPIVCAEYVTAEDGTGCVHIAPGHGQEDHVVGKNNDLPMIMPVDDKGVLTDEAGQFAGLHVHKANKAIVEHMEQTGVLLKLQFIEHSYPHCWRCHNPVIFRATEQWFISIDHNDLRQRALKSIRETTWVPEWGIKRIQGMVEGRPDWCISRQRLWGLRIPLDDVNDIMDVWLESGASWATLLGKKQADLYLEGSDQHRGWFQSSLLLSVAINDQAPYKAVLTHGFTVDEKGRKMSKSTGNVVDPLKVIEQYGADILRLWVVSTQFKDDMSISDNLLKQVSDSYRKIRNTWRFLLSNLYDFSVDQSASLPVSQFTKIDQWILLRLQKLVAAVEKAYEEYEYHKIYHAVHNFCANDLSAFYQDMVKDRLYCDAVDSPARRSTQTAIYLILDTLLKLMAPILSFTTEEVWGYLQKMEDGRWKMEDKTVQGSGFKVQGSTTQNLEPRTLNLEPRAADTVRGRSIHLEDFPSVDPQFLNPELEKQWDEIFEIRSQAYQKIEEARQAKTIGGSLDAKVSLTLTKDFGLKTTDWELILIVSQVELKEGKVLAVAVNHADGEKCERCWKWGGLEGVLCSRCGKVVKNL